MTTPPNNNMDFMRQMWSNMGFGLPGMVTPTMDVDEIAKRITDLKAVEGWLKMNLSMLQMTIQGLEVQGAALSAVRAMSQPGANGEMPGNPFANPALWSWPFTQPAESASDDSPPEDSAPDDFSPDDSPPDTGKRPSTARKAGRK